MSFEQCPMVLFFTLIVLIIFINILWYWMKLELKSKGYKVGFFTSWSHYKDIPNMHRLARKERDPRSKKKYKRVLGAFYISIVLVVLTTLFSVIVSSIP